MDYNICIHLTNLLQNSVKMAKFIYELCYKHLSFKFFIFHGSLAVFKLFKNDLSYFHLLPDIISIIIHRSKISSFFTFYSENLTLTTNK